MQAVWGHILYSYAYMHSQNSVRDMYPCITRHTDRQQGRLGYTAVNCGRGYQHCWQRCSTGSTAWQYYACRQQYRARRRCQLAPARRRGHKQRAWSFLRCRCCSANCPVLSALLLLQWPRTALTCCAFPAPIPSTNTRIKRVRTDAGYICAPTHNTAAPCIRPLARELEIELDVALATQAQHFFCHACCRLHVPPVVGHLVLHVHLPQVRQPQAQLCKGGDGCRRAKSGEGRGAIRADKGAVCGPASAEAKLAGQKRSNARVAASPSADARANRAEVFELVRCHCAHPCVCMPYPLRTSCVNTTSMHFQPLKGG